MLAEVPTSYGFQKRKRLRETDEISSVFSFKCQIYGQYLRVLVKRNDVGNPRFTGIVRKKTVPLSVTRNYIKRCLREMFRRNQNLFGGLDMVVLANKSFAGESFEQVEQEFLRLIMALQEKLAG